MRTTPLEDTLVALAAPVVAELGFALVRIRAQGSEVQIMAENPTTHNLGIEDCAAISRALSPVFDVADVIKGPWRLEVSSPGLDRPLMCAQDFVHYTGKVAKVEREFPDDNGQKRFRGILRGVADGAVQMDTDTGVVAIPLSAISKAKLVDVAACAAAVSS